MLTSSLLIWSGLSSCIPELHWAWLTGPNGLCMDQSGEAKTSSSWVLDVLWDDPPSPSLCLPEASIPQARPEIVAHSAIAWAHVGSILAQESVDSAGFILPWLLDLWSPNHSLQGSLLKTPSQVIKNMHNIIITIYRPCISSNWHCYFEPARKAACQELTRCVMSPKQKHTPDKCRAGCPVGFPRLLQVVAFTFSIFNMV